MNLIRPKNRQTFYRFIYFLIFFNVRFWVLPLSAFYLLRTFLKHRLFFQLQLHKQRNAPALRNVVMINELLLQSFTE